MKGDVFAVRRPRRLSVVVPGVGVGVVVVGELAHVEAVGVHHEDLRVVVTVAVAGEGDVVAVRRPRRVRDPTVAGGELTPLRTVGVHYENMRVRAEGHAGDAFLPLIVVTNPTTPNDRFAPAKGDVFAVRRPRRVRDRTVVIVVVGELTYLGAVGVHHEDLPGAVAVAGEGDVFAVRRPRRVRDRTVVVGELAHVGAVGVHHEDLPVAVAVHVGRGRVSRLVAPAASSAQRHARQHGRYQEPPQAPGRGRSCGHVRRVGRPVPRDAQQVQSNPS